MLNALPPLIEAFGGKENFSKFFPRSARTENFDKLIFPVILKRSIRWLQLWWQIGQRRQFQNVGLIPLCFTQNASGTVRESEADDV